MARFKKYSPELKTQDCTKTVSIIFGRLRIAVGFMPLVGDQTAAFTGG
jgi:hypothetical protein